MYNSSNHETIVNDVLVKFDTLKPLYERLVDEVKFIIETKLSTTDLKIVSMSGRAKTRESIRKKLERKQYTDPLRDIKDFAGVRVVCNYKADIATLRSIITENFHVHEIDDKTEYLSTDRMGYHGTHYIVTLGPSYSGARYEEISDMFCEIQTRTILQDAWALISHHLVYKDEKIIPPRLHRDLNNVAALLEIAQGVFDMVREKRASYLNEISSKKTQPSDFLAQELDYDTLREYTSWKFPNLPVSEIWHQRLMQDIDQKVYRTLQDLDDVIERTKDAVEQYNKEKPDYFTAGTDYITKSLGFADESFRNRHPFCTLTMEAFKKYQRYVKERLPNNKGSQHKLNPLQGSNAVAPRC